MMPLIIEKLYAWIAEEDNGSQGIIAFAKPDGGWLPLVGANRTVIEAYRNFAADLSYKFKKKIFLMEFSTQKILETIGKHENRNH